MTIFQALLLGLVQGVTEFLPISSSGHLVLIQHLLSINEPVLVFDTFLHLASLLAIVIYFWPKLIKLKLKEWLIVLVATIPVVVAGLLLKDYAEALFASTKLVGITLVLTGVINFWIDKKLEQRKTQAVKSYKKISWRQALKIGCWQAVAIIPGISRSGSTLAGGLHQKFSRIQAFEFAFFLAIPAILGATVLQILQLSGGLMDEIQLPIYLVGGLATLISGLASLASLNFILRRAQFQWFGYYSLTLGLFSLFLL